MKLRFLALVAALFVGVFGASGAAYAQNKVYVVDIDAIRNGSKVGGEFNQKLKGSLEAFKNDAVAQLGLTELGTQIKTEQDSINPQLQALADKDGNVKLDALNPTLKSRYLELKKKESEYVQKSRVLQQDLDQQTQVSLASFTAALGPSVAAVAKQEGADMVLKVSTLWYATDKADLSPKVIAYLDQHTPTLEKLEASLPKPPADAAKQQ